MFTQMFKHSFVETWQIIHSSAQRIQVQFLISDFYTILGIFLEFSHLLFPSTLEMLHKAREEDSFLENIT
jgi:HJR/Mrr/RecB family endonuclease